MGGQDYKDFLKTTDILEASQKAKEKSMALLEDQGLAAVALALSQTLAELVQRHQEILRKVS
ncbi:hypothetical protein HKBW3S03_01323 [Candidatus Hakubella thermalkaliphila]|uniref:Uncharacterized protein n=1 Tax=Candidatus Hakubella thermalkaliphila TaxID=2754717 RepID=A0A6V8Q498_9ACTN|nr:hypothetical protein [Candidatus Hakubella thermalkaliphila]GFP19819.1 hypothetical protein HKBW3S03_01323 [Candidatus Hakubella thermalkaliphila]GFP23725.1 hypothetical protein HKBW3S09_01190 [Candidatus Hakubella thermalkaliphila]GFP30823.1 hypothetical protein HKBW3S34_01743 [Candidatus Hakubella thermalkaliphila]GFP35563.1 hypothetical protein HKBW3S43_01354 [Candidatus Hakubella thermalkaliphila]GFP38111.1 hypothetical protein HKBW3S44_01791 [Candidatus Hakubella thermalkaliphila]